jgi:hypothetical protein
MGILAYVTLNASTFAPVRIFRRKFYCIAVEICYSNRQNINTVSTQTPAEQFTLSVLTEVTVKM